LLFIKNTPETIQENVKKMNKGAKKFHDKLKLKELDIVHAAV